MNLNQELTELLKNEGCNIVGFADLSSLPKDPRKALGCGIIMGTPYTAEGMRANLDGDIQKFCSDSGATFEPLERYKKAAV